MARIPWNKGLTAASSEVIAAAEAKRRARRERRARSQATRAGLYSEQVDYRLVIQRDGWVCGICSGAVVADDLSFDHIIPFRDGGEHVFENVRVTHAACNSRKGELESRDARVAAIRRKADSNRYQ